MNVAEYIYYANVLKNLDTYLSLISIIGLVFALIFTLAYAVPTDKYHKKNYLIIVPLLGLFLTVFIPSERTMYMMAGAAVGEKVIESKAGKQALEIIELKLDEEINKLKGTKK